MATSWETIFELSERLGQKLLENGARLATAESCTGGGISYAVTEIPGSSQWFVGGIVCYSNDIKQQIEISANLIAQKGAVSEEVVVQMASNVAKLMASNISVATSGIAGPDGGTDEKPVGTVCFGWHINGIQTAETKYFSGSRMSIRLQSIEYSLKTLLQRL